MKASIPSRWPRSTPAIEPMVVAAVRVAAGIRGSPQIDSNTRRCRSGDASRLTTAKNARIFGRDNTSDRRVPAFPPLPPSPVRA
jgi:hypothetical protein